MKEPKDLGIKINSEEGIFWDDMKIKMLEGIKNAKREIEINTQVLEFAETRILEEKEKFK